MQEEQLMPEDRDTAIPSRRETSKKKKEKSTLREMIEVIITALVLAFVIKTFVVGNFWIPSESMVPTIEVNDKVIVTNFSYWFNEPQRGDVIVFKYPNDTRVDYIKRCIGLPGETVEFRDSRLYINGEPVAEPYLPEDLTFDDYGPVTVPEGQYFMCGDNRNNSADSRAWGFLDRKLIIGKAQCIYWPFDRWKKL